MLTAEHATGVQGSIQLWNPLGLSGWTSAKEQQAIVQSAMAQVRSIVPARAGSGVSGFGDSSISSTVIGVLLGGALIIGVIGFAASKEGRRTDAERRAHAVMNPRSDRPWAKKGVFRGLGDTIHFLGTGSRRRRRGRR